jgi:predicted esterase YcpF (UPF0227 family)
MQPGKLFFYFNGFNSAIRNDYSGSPKIVAVADFAQSRGYQFVPVSICYREAGKHSLDILALVGDDVDEVIFCGSSLGGWFARIMQLLLEQQRPAIRTASIAFNPAYHLSMYGHLLLGPQLNYVTQEQYEWTMEHSDALRALERSVQFGAPSPFFVYVDEGDEVIGWERSAARHSPISRFISYKGGCHSFDHYIEALTDFESVFTK